MPRLSLSDDEAQVLAPVLEAYRQKKALIAEYNSALDDARAVLREAIKVWVVQGFDEADLDSIFHSLRKSL